MDGDPTDDDFEYVVNYLDQQAAQAETEKPFINLGDALSGIGDALGGLRKALPAAYYRLTEGFERPDKYSSGARAAFDAEAEYAKSMQDESTARLLKGEASSTGDTFRSIGPSLGFSAASMAAAIPAGAVGAKVGAAGGAAVGGGVGALFAGVGAAPGAAVGGIVGGAVGGVGGSMTAAGTAAYRMAGSQFLDDAFKTWLANNPQADEAAREEAYQELLPLAKDAALWEAGPEAIGTVVGLGAGKVVLGLGKQTLTKLATGALGKAGIKAGALAGGVGAELLTETATQIGQGEAQAKANAFANGQDMSQVKSPYDVPGGALQALKEVAPQTLALSSLMLGSGGVIKAASSMRRVTPVQSESSDPSTPPQDAATGGNVLSQIAARGGRVDAPLETDATAPVPDAETGAAKPESSAPLAAYPTVFDMTPSVPTNPDTAAPPAVQPAPDAEAGSLTASVSATAPGATLPSAAAPTTAAVARLPTGQDQVTAPVETGLPATPTPDAAPLRDTAPPPASTPQGVSAAQAMPGSDAAAALPTTPAVPPTSPSQATAPTQPRPAAENVTRTRAAERVLTTQGVDPETAAVLAARLSETLPADMPLEQLRERVMEEFTAAGGTLPGSVPKRYVEDARAYEATGYSPQEAAMHAANAKAANDQDVAAAHQKNLQLREVLSRPRVKMSKPGQTTRQRLSAWWKGYAQNLLSSHRRGDASSKTDLLEIASEYAVPGEMRSMEIDPSAYPKTARQGSLSPQSRTKQAQTGVNLLRQNAPEIAQGIRLVTNRDALNEADFHPDDWAGMAETEGFFDPRTGETVIFTDQVEIREGETMPRAVARVAIHERLGHAGLETLRQSDPTFAKRWAAIVESIENDPTLSAEVAAIAEQPGYEHLAEDPNGLVEEWFARRAEALNEADLKALKPTSALGKLWQALKDLLNRWTRNFSRAEWTARELREVMALSKQTLRDGGPVGVESDGRVKQARKLNPIHGSNLPNWLKKPFNIPADAPFRVQNLGLRAMLKGSALPSELLPFARQSERDIAAIRQTSAQVRQDLNESLTAYAERSGKTLEEVHELAAKAMEDPVILQALPDPVLKERVRRARNLLDDLSAAVGKFAGGDLGAAILKNRGHWMRRSYACFDEAANWTYDSLTKAAGKGEKINGVLASKVLKDARDYVTRNVTAQRAAAKEPAPKPGEIEAIMRQLTDRNVWERSLQGNMQGSGVSKDVTSLMHRAAYHPDVGVWMKRNGIKDWDYQTVASLAATGGNWQGRNAAVTLAAARASLALLHPKATAAEINDMLRQQDIAAPLRALMGEEVNPVKRFLSSSSFQAQYIARHEQQVAMRDLGLQMGLFSMQQTGVFTEELGDGRERNGFQVEVPQKTPNGQTVMVRKAIYTTPETLAALRMSQGSANPADLGGRLVEALKFIGSEAKLNKVALNPDSWMVNALGNFMGLIQSGDLLSLQGWSNVARAIELHRSGKAKSGDAADAAAEAIQDKRRELLARLTAAGVANSGLEMSDVEAALDNRVTQFINEHDTWNAVTGGVRGAILGNGLGRPFGWAGQTVGAVVGGVAGAKLGSETIQKAQRKVAEWTTGNPDRFAKIAAFYGNYEAHLAAGMVEADAFALATEKTMNTLPDYSKLPDLMRQLSRLGLMGSFIGFQYEVYRNAYWNARYSMAEIKSGNPALVARGTRRMIGLSSMMTLAAFGLSGMIRGMFGAGVDDDKDEAYRRALGADHERFGTLAYTKLDEEGASFFNTSYLLPQVTLFEVMKAGIEGRDLGESLSNTAKQLTDQFVSGSVHLDPLIAAWTNQRPIGGKVTYEEGPRGMAERVAYFLYVTMEPGALNKEDRIVRALQERGRYGRQFSLDEELKRFLGIRQNTYTHEERIKSRLFRFRDSYDDARSLARTAYRQGDPNALDTLARANERIGKLQGEWEQFQTDLQTIGLPMNKFEQIRKAVGTAREFPLLIMGENGPESERVRTAKAYRSDAEAAEDTKARGLVKSR